MEKTFTNPALNAKYKITGEDHEIEIQAKEHRYKGLLSGIKKEETARYLIDRGHSLISEKTAAAAVKPEPVKP